jgi:hypothetical protein
MGKNKVKMSVSETKRGENMVDNNLSEERRDAEWRTMSGEWRRSLSTLLSTLDTVNKKRYEVERQKELIRRALTQGKYDVIERERALEFYRKWNRGIQMVPLYPEDYAQRLPQAAAALPQAAAALQFQQDQFLSNKTSPKGEKVALLPLAESTSTAVAPDVEPMEEVYVYDFDAGLLASQAPRQWIQVAPPPLLNPEEKLFDTTVIVDQPVYPVTAIADWRVKETFNNNNPLPTLADAALWPTATYSVLANPSLTPPMPLLVQAPPPPIPFAYPLTPFPNVTTPSVYTNQPFTSVNTQSLKNHPKKSPFSRSSNTEIISKQKHRLFYPGQEIIPPPPPPSIPTPTE